MSIDELLRDALTEAASTAPPATDAGWAAIEDRSNAMRRTTHRRRLAVVALGVAAAVLAGVIVVGLSNRSTSDTDNLFVGEPTTVPAGDQTTGPVPAADVTPALPAPDRSGSAQTPVSWLIARTGSTDRELILYILNSDEGGCGTDYAASVDDRSDAVTVTLLPVPKEPSIPTASCIAIGRVRRRAVSVELPEPLAGRRVIDGARADSTGTAPVDGHSLLVPDLPAGMAAQTEFLSDTWSVCYAATAVLCSERLIAGGTVATSQGPLLGYLVQQLGIPVGEEQAVPTDSSATVDWLLQHWIWPDPTTPPFVLVTIHGHPALIFGRPGSADRLGDTVVLWTDGPSPDHPGTWFALGVSAQMGLTGTELVVLAESMQPAG